MINFRIQILFKKNAVPNSKKSRYAPLSFVIKCENQHVEDIMNSLSDNTIKNFLSEKIYQNYTNETKCIEDMKKHFLSSLKKWYNEVAAKSINKWDEGANAPHTYRWTYPDVGDYILEFLSE